MFLVLGAILALAATGSDVVSAVEAKAPACPQIVLERHAVGETIRFPRSTTACEAASTGTGIAGVATARGRVLWLYYAGGNLRDWLLYTASTTQRTPRRIAFVERPVEEPAPIVLGRADETDLPYAIGATVVDLSPNGARRWTWTAPGPVAQLAAGNDRVAVQLGDGRTFVVAKTGKPGAVQQLASGTIRYAAAGVAVQSGTSVQLGSKTFSIGKQAQLVDLVRNLLVYVRNGQIRGIRMDTGKGALLARGTLASLGSGGLAYVSGTRVRWLPWSKL